MDKIFGNRLVLLRKNERLSQEEAAIKIGIGLRTLQSNEVGQWPNRKNQEKYIDFYGCNRIWFLTGEGEPFPGEEVSDKPPIGELENIPYGKIDNSFGTTADALKEIFDSHDPVLIDAIRANLYLFRLYAQKDRQTKQQSQEIQALKEKYDELKKVLEDLDCKKGGAESL